MRRRAGGGPRERGAPKVGAQRVEGPKIRAFSLSRHNFLSFGLPSLGGLLVEFWWCLKRWDPEMYTFGLSGCRVKPWRLCNAHTILPFCLLLVRMTRRTHDTRSRSSTCWHHRGWTPSASRYSGWDRRDTWGGSSSGHEDECANCGNAGDCGNDCAAEGDTDENRDKDNASRARKETEAEKGSGKVKRKRTRVNEKGKDRKSINITKKDLWLDSSKSCLSSTCKKNSEANTEVYDSNETTVAAPDRRSVRNVRGPVVCSRRGRN